MSGTLGPLERNLFEVSGQPDSARRAVAIAEIYTVNCTFFEAGERIVGREALNVKIQRKLPDLCFARKDLLKRTTIGRLQWHLGPAGVPPVVTGMDVAIFEHGRIRALYTFLDKRAIESAQAPVTTATLRFVGLRTPERLEKYLAWLPK